VAEQGGETGGGDPLASTQLLSEAHAAGLDDLDRVVDPVGPQPDAAVFGLERSLLVDAPGPLQPAVRLRVLADGDV
jgi:hypothetical protein